MSVALPIARTTLESFLYMELRPCACGEPKLAVSETELLQDREGNLVLRRTGSCPRCEKRRQFLFGVPEIAESGGVSWEMFFGGQSPSQIIDAGEWLELAQRLGRAVPAGRSRLPWQRRQRREALTEAVAAMNEVLKFIPDGADAVPADAFWSDRGTAKYRAAPQEFRRGRLRVFRAGLLSSLTELGGPLFRGREISGRIP